MTKILLRVWRMLRGRGQMRVLWIFHAKFMIGVCGIVQNEQGQILLLKHRFWPPATPWGLSSGYAKAGETLESTITREVKEETQLDIKVNELVTVNSGFQLRLEAIYKAELLGGEITVDPKEIFEA